MTGTMSMSNVKMLETEITLREEVTSSLQLRITANAGVQAMLVSEIHNEDRTAVKPSLDFSDSWDVSKSDPYIINKSEFNLTKLLLVSRFIKSSPADRASVILYVSDPNVITTRLVCIPL